MKCITKTGFEVEIIEENLNNMELVDALANVSDGHVLEISKVCTLLLGKENKARLYDHVRLKTGQVPTEKINEEINDIFSSSGEQIKK